MKAAVAYLEPHLEKTDARGKGTIVLATVKGDVHDIGKNLVDIILTNNGYTVVNLGIKQPIIAIIDAAQEQHADAIGMSGLLVKSTVVMKENLEELNRRGWPRRTRSSWAEPHSPAPTSSKIPRDLCRRGALRPRDAHLKAAADGRTDGGQARRGGCAAGATGAAGQGPRYDPAGGAG